MNPDMQALRPALAPFEKADLAASIFQFTTALVLFVGACAIMYWSLQWNYGITLALSVPTGALLVRIFIIQHDCGHGSYFRSARLNNRLGFICGVLTMTPYGNWRRQHAGHHAVWNNLDKRYSGADIYSACLTVTEYRALPPLRRWFYRMVRHPIIAHLVIPPLVFLVLYRFSFDTPQGWTAERRAVHVNNALMAAIIGGLGWSVGFADVFMVQVPVMSVAAIIGVWLFALQHRFENTAWSRQSEWRYVDASLNGSSYLKLPRPLQWFTGNIGFHHIHHLAPGIPNYRLESCQRDVPALQAIQPLDLGAALASIRLALWDEDVRRMVRFNEVA